MYIRRELLCQCNFMYLLLQPHCSKNMHYYNYMHDDHNACRANYSYPCIHIQLYIPYKIEVGNEYVNKYCEICDIYVLNIWSIITSNMQSVAWL